jgi:hypothetical protein
VEEVDRLLEQMCIPVSALSLRGITENPDVFLGAMVALLAERPDWEIAYKMLRTRWRKFGSLSNNPEYVQLSGYDRKLTFMEQFESWFEPRLGVRADTFRLLFEEVIKRKVTDLLVVETGCIRIPGNWQFDGQSSFMFDELIAYEGGMFFTVDCTSESADTARQACSPHTCVVLNDSVAFLYKLSRICSRKVSLLYLDSFDVDPANPLPSAIHHIKELTAAWPMIGPGSVICCDDYGGGQGKGMIIDDFMSNILGTKVLFQGVQKAWVVI